MITSKNVNTNNTIQFIGLNQIALGVFCDGLFLKLVSKIYCVPKAIYGYLNLKN